MALKIKPGILLVAFLATCASTPFAQNTAAAIYQSKCQMCHGADGTGNTPAGKAMKVTSFKSPALVKASDAELFAETKNGKGRMPAYASRMSDAQIHDVIAYIRKLQK